MRILKKIETEIEIGKEKEQIMVVNINKVLVVVVEEEEAKIVTRWMSPVVKNMDMVIVVTVDMVVVMRKVNLIVRIDINRKNMVQVKMMLNWKVQNDLKVIQQRLKLN